MLYAPTWQGPFADSRVYSLPVGRQIVEQLLARGARVIFRAHPFNYRYRRRAEDDRRDRRGARRRPGRDRPRAPVGTGRRAGDEHRGLLQRLRRDDQRRVRGGLGLSALRQAVRHGLGGPRPRSNCWWTRRPPGRRTCCGKTCRTSARSVDDLLGADPLAAVSAARPRSTTSGDFPDETYAEVPACRPRGDRRRPQAARLRCRRVSTVPSRGVQLGQEPRDVRHVMVIDRGDRDRAAQAAGPERAARPMEIVGLTGRICTAVAARGRAGRSPPAG